MGAGSGNRTYRDLQTLYAGGPAWALDDVELIGRFLDRNGPSGEDAFAALVRKHGPMVLGVCRRMLRDSADAEDAFQAVFLVLARRARSLRAANRLGAWLYGVAVRTARESRRRSARRRAREGGLMDASRLASAPSAEAVGDDLSALIDEEIDKLPDRYRDPIRLCDLEGLSRRDAARRLGLPEGTLSSRLARGRVLLRQRLSRRGLAPEADRLSAPTVVPMLSQSLADSTVRLALSFAAGGPAVGAVPAAVLSLATGVLRMLTLTRFTMIGLASVLTLTTAVGLAATYRAARTEPTPSVPPPVSATPSVVKEATPLEPDSTKARVRGTVVDEQDRPVSGVEVRSDPFTPFEARGVTGADGSFDFSTGKSLPDYSSLLARSADGRLSAVRPLWAKLTSETAGQPVRLVMKPAREILVRVRDGEGVPAANASVGAAGRFMTLDVATAGGDGTARLLLPADAPVEAIYASKSGVGYEAAGFGPVDERNVLTGGLPVGDVPGEVVLRLQGAWKARLKAVDRTGRPIAGVDFGVPMSATREGPRRSGSNADRNLTATTGPDGVATFDWLPLPRRQLAFIAFSDQYTRRPISLDGGEVGETPVTVTLTPSGTIRGRVTFPDGSPAPNIYVTAFGSGQANFPWSSRLRTDADGRYATDVNAGEVYAVFVEDEQWTAPTRLDVAVREGQRVPPVDFRLTRGTELHGTITVGPDRKPAAGERFTIEQRGDLIPEDLRVAGDRERRPVRLTFAVADDQGRYAIRLAPGTYKIYGPPRTRDETITITDEVEIIRDYAMPRPLSGPIAGRVIHDGQGVAGARVQFAPMGKRSTVAPATTDAEGRFRVSRNLDASIVSATSADGQLGAMVEIGAEDPEVVIELAPTASATGRILDEQGQPVAKDRLNWGRRVYQDEERKLSMLWFGPRVDTDAEGRFTLPALVPGQEYEVGVWKENAFRLAGKVRPKGPGPIDLGTLRLQGNQDE